VAEPCKYCGRLALTVGYADGTVEPAGERPCDCKEALKDRIAALQAERDVLAADLRWVAEHVVDRLWSTNTKGDTPYICLRAAIAAARREDKP
jgi:hypothetical protein